LSAFDEVVYSKTTALFYQSSGNTVAVVDLRLGNTIATQHLSSKSNQQIITACASPYKEGLFFIAVTGEFAVYAVSRHSADSGVPIHLNLNCSSELNKALRVIPQMKFKYLKFVLKVA
jgi:hypothetical protein